MNQTLHSVILAAGKGTRMKSRLPKVLQVLAGKTLLGHVLDTAKAIDSKVHVVYGHGGDLVQEAFKEEDVNWVLQAEQNGTGHAVQVAMPSLKNDDDMVLVLYGDVPLISKDTLETLTKSASESGLAVLTVKVDNPFGYGRIVRNEQGHVLRIVEQKDANDEELAINEINSGILAAKAGHMRKWLSGLKNDNAQGEYYLTDVVAAAVKDGMNVSAVFARSEAEVAGVNDKVQLSQVEASYRQQRAEELMRAGVTIADPTRIDIRGEVEVGQDVFIDVNVILEGKVKLDDGVHVGPNTVITDSQIEQDTVIYANSVIEKGHIGPRCKIGPYARVRPETFLGSEVKLGNFVEIKKSVVAKGSKVNHLTYIGDAKIETNVNVGAGTVTCNYDGVNKFKTVIKEGAFIGSGSMLVAPVEIGKNATVAAGSVITKDTPDEELVIGRARQKTIPGWKRPVKEEKK